MAKTVAGAVVLHDPLGQRVPVIFDSPHSGAEYPEDFGFVAPVNAVRRTEDAYVNELYREAPKNGATFLAALFPRSYIDPNRSLLDLDPGLLGEPWPGPLEPGEKTRLGSGLIWRTCPPDLPMYDRKLTVAEVRERIETYYKPYHAALAEALDSLLGRFGKVWHVNCHSMPSVSTAKSPEGPGVRRPHFVLGDRDGTSSAPEFTALVRDALVGFGYEVKVNDPYKGAELVRAYSDPAAGRHSLQIEVNRALYMDEDGVEKNSGFARLQADITRLIAAICDYARNMAI